MRPPAHWYGSDEGRSTAGDRLAALLLLPLSLLYWAGSATKRALTRPRDVGLPLIIIGNASSGGTGKTPIARWLGHRLRLTGHGVHLVTRGYGGRLAGPLLVKPSVHGSNDIGDEALLLAAAGPTWVARRRALGALAAAAAGASAVIMDDGLQNPTLKAAFALLLVDGPRGFGNGFVLPAGPLRERVSSALGRSDAILVMGPPRPGLKERLLRARKPIFMGRLEAAEPPPAGRLLAFAGIENPARFERTLRAAGGDVAGTSWFPDHHPFSREDLESLEFKAAALGARLITTEKDFVRLPAAARPAVTLFRVQPRIDDEEGLLALIAKALASAGGDWQKAGP